jgi:uncharacterized protein YidB (DUF937 family)
MGFLDEMLGKLTGGGSPSGNLSALAPLVMEMLQSHPGGIRRLEQSFKRAGLGHLISSWVGPSSNLPVSADQVQKVLGGDVLEDMAVRAGVPSDQVAPALTQLLPHMVDHLTPAGKIPD